MGTAPFQPIAELLHFQEGHRVEAVGPGLGRSESVFNCIWNVTALKCSPRPEYATTEPLVADQRQSESRFLPGGGQSKQQKKPLQLLSAQADFTAAP